MSKFLNNYFLPGAGVATLALGLGVGMANRDYGAQKIDGLEARLGQVEAQASSSSALASAESAKAAELQEKVAALQSDFAARASSGGSLTQPAPAVGDGYGLGRVALPEEITAWDVDVRPDGRGLPEGRGDVLWGEEVFADKCASCHGDFAEGVDNWPVLAGGFDTLADKDPVKTVGSYWPYLSTVWDYVHRSMPFGAAQTLTDDEVYGIVAYILYSNDLVDEDFELSHENFAAFSMHNGEGFVIDDRAEAEYAMWSAEPCMENCKDSVEITMRASVLDVTPDEEGASDAAETTPTAEPTAEPAAVATAVAALDPELVKSGEKVFKKCKACHQVGDGAKNRSGPQLNGIFGRAFAAADGFKYSNAFKEAAAEGRVWDEAEISAFLAKPKSYIKGTKMSFAGLRKESDIAAIIAYLQSVGN